MTYTQNHYLLAAGAVAIMAELALVVWLALTQQLSATQWILVLGLGLLVTLSVFAAILVWFEQRLFMPLRVLSEQIELMVGSNPALKPRMPDTHALGSLPAAIDELGKALLTTRTDMSKAMQAAAVHTEYRNARLEAVLRDLSEGLVVCNLQHQVVLYNERARKVLGRDDMFGLRRPIGDFMEGEAIANALKELQRLHAEQPEDRPALEFDCGLRMTPASNVQVRMTLIVETTLVCVGYVITIMRSDEAVSGAPARDRVVAARPEFYDFDLFEQASDTPLLQTSLQALEYVVFDTETTGLRPSEGDEIIQLAGVRVVNGRVLKSEQFDELIDPGRPIPAGSTRIHGITDAMVRQRPSADVVFPLFHQFARNAVLVAHNAAFDMKFLTLKESSIGVCFDQPVLDTMLLSMVLSPSQTDHTLDGLADRFGIDNVARHTALGDAQATAAIFVRMIAALTERQIMTLDDALERCNSLYSAKRLQEDF